ncbi:MAG: hypothetical protein H7Y10_03660 [Flavobacterium sp.]|nr:hypothetical protein [Flavobacterium sp.]
MSKQILRVRRTGNLRQLKKYVDESLEKGAETIRFVHFESENPYFIFESDFTPEEENAFELEKLKKEFKDKLELLESRKYKTHSFRIKGNGLCGADIDKLIDEFKIKNNIKESLRRVIKQVINESYDDFDEGMETVFITEVIEKQTTS